MQQFGNAFDRASRPGPRAGNCAALQREVATDLQMVSGALQLQGHAPKEPAKICEVARHMRFCMQQLPAVTYVFSHRSPPARHSGTLLAALSSSALPNKVLPQVTVKIKRDNCPLLNETLLGHSVNPAIAWLCGRSASPPFAHASRKTFM